MTRLAFLDGKVGFMELVQVLRKAYKQWGKKSARHWCSSPGASVWRGRPAVACVLSRRRAPSAAAFALLYLRSRFFTRGAGSKHGHRQGVYQTQGFVAREARSPLERGRHALRRARRGYPPPPGALFIARAHSPTRSRMLTNMSAESLVPFQRAMCIVLAVVQPAVQQHHHHHDAVTVALLQLDLQVAPGSVQPECTSARWS